MSGPAALIYVHGLWMSGAESMLLRRRLAAAHGYQTLTFRYASVRKPLAAHIAALADAIAAVEAPQVHLVGHSLGGLVILRCLERYPVNRPGRVVFIGTPSVASQAVRHIGQWAWGRTILGATVAEELLRQPQRHWGPARELGIIAGSSSMGLAKLLVRFREENDGVIAVSETRLPGAKQHLCLRASHSGMLFSARVARETGSFLEYGTFGR
ncbi:MAG TPA: alpha/beta hydrolase [Steroidobacteraceae bacterium]|jgi:pimeloyl-ACP methyl ester carboxylesterase|nr:alpha/beta hydrolase [Steroidobacteraceae bacterium]